MAGQKPKWQFGLATGIWSWGGRQSDGTEPFNFRDLTLIPGTQRYDLIEL